MKSRSVSKPLVVLTRSREGNAELSQKLETLGIGSVSIDTVEFTSPDDWRDFDAAVAKLDGFDWVAFTSPRAVKSFSERLQGLGVTSKGPRYASVGSSTSAEMRRYGIPTDFVPSEFLTSNLAKELPVEAGESVLLCRADIANRELDDGLKERGCKVTSVTAYLNAAIEGKVSDERLDGAKVLLFASPSEVVGMVGRLADATLASLRRNATAVCIGPVTEKAAREAGFKDVAVAGVHTIDGLVGELRRQIGDA